MKLKWIFLTSLMFLTSCSQTDHVDGGSLVSGGQIISTIYYFPHYQEADLNCKEEEKFSLLNQKDEVIVVACKEIYENCALQGSCTIEQNDQNIGLAYDGVREGTKRFRLTDFDGCEFAQGVKKLCLTPYYSIAADLNFHDVGDVFYLPDVEGIQLPDQSYHSGYFVVEDTGSKIVGEHRFDFFTGRLGHKKEENPFAQLGLSDQKSGLSYFKVSGDRAEQARLRLLSNKPNQINIL